MMKAIRDIDELKAIYGEPREAAVIKVTPVITPAYRALIERSPFMALATAGPEGLDCSPRGDRGAVVHVEDERTVILPDRQGNNRIDSLANIVRDPRVSLMFLTPGSASIVRINGEAIVTVDGDMLARFVVEHKAPRSIILVTVKEVYFQCARAVMRAGLWDIGGHVDPGALPTAGEMLRQASTSSFDAEAYDRDWAERARATMW